MEKKGIDRRVHCLVLAYPAQGHINPMLQFSKLLIHRGVRVTLVSTYFYIKSLQMVPPSTAIGTISDGFDEGGPTEAGGTKAYIDRFWQVGPETLGKLLEKFDKSEQDHVDCIIYDAFLPWALEIAKRFGILVAAYLTQNMVVNSIYYHVHLGKLQVPLTQQEFCLPFLPKLQLEDMPSFLLTYEEDPALLHFLVGQFSNIHKADWILCNSFYELDKGIEDWTMKIWPQFRSIGPNIPSMFLDKRIKDDQDYGVVQFKSDEESIKWLDNKPKGSVVYVSFGSLVSISEEQVEELANGLKECSSYFLWVVRASEETKLPKNYEKRTEKGLVVHWCSQLKVLAHEAIGCFVTHGGWNSTLEALCLGVPMIVAPQWSDQSTNAKNIVDVWKMGIRAPVDEKKVVRGEVLKDCIREMMESEKGKEINRNAIHWKTLAASATGEGGSSDKNITEFVNNLFHLQATCPELQIPSSSDK